MILSQIFIIALAAIQQTPTPAAPDMPRVQHPAPPPSNDIVVTGLKDIESPGSLVTHATLGSSRNGRGAVASRTAFAMADRFARCAVSRGANTERLREALDGRIHGARQAFAQARLIQTNATCTTDPSAVQGIVDPRAVTTTFADGYDGTYYDRGALFIRALRVFAPDLRLTAEQTGNPAVQARFNARETSLARFRLPVDMRYFETAVCLVRVQPGLAVELVRADKPNAIARLEAAIVNRGKVCVGGARRVYFDPTQFRFYIADAVYRWAVAVKGVDSLIPAG